LRFFADDAVPGLALPVHELPAPWVLPYHLPRWHRYRLVALLGRALAGFEPGFRVVELSWPERSLLSERRLRLPDRTVVCWRIDETQKQKSVEIVRESARHWPGPALYDFRWDDELPAQGWLGPLKMAVLYRLIDVLLDERPVQAVEPITDLLREGAGKLSSPIDLIDFFEVLVEQLAVHTDLAMARAQGFASVLAARFDDQTDAADVMVQVLVALTAGNGLPEPQRALAKRVGLMDTGGAVLPIADLLGEREVARRTVLQLVTRHRLGSPLWELAPGWFARGQDGGTRVPLSRATLDFRALAEKVSPTGVMEGRVQLPPQEEIDRQVRRALQALKTSRSRVRRKEAVRQLNAAAALLALEIGDRQGTVTERVAPLYEAAAEAYLELGKVQEAARAFIQAGIWRFRADQHAEGEAVFTRARTVAEKTGSEQLQAESLYGLGIARYMLHNPTGAREAYETALAYFQKLQDRPGEANTRMALGDVYQRTDRLKEAEETYQQVLALYGEIDDRLGEANTRMALGDVYQRTARLKEAEETYQQVLALYGAIDDRLGEANTRMTLGDVYQRTARLKEAEETYQQALTLYRAIDERLGQANALRNLARLTFLMGERVPDEQWAENVRLAQEVADPHGEWLSQTLRAAACFKTDPSTARTTWTAAHRYFEGAGLRLESILTQALLQIAGGDTRDQVCSFLSAQLGDVTVAPLRAAQDQDALVRGIVALLPTA